MSSVVRPRLLITQQMPSKIISALESMFNIDYHDKPTPLPREQILARAEKFAPEAMLFSGQIKIDKDLLTAAGKQLRMLATFSVGFDHIDINECKQRGIKIGYTPGVLTDATADLAVTLLLATSRRVKEAMRSVYNGEWGSSSNVTWMCGKPLVQSTIGIVGLGRIGLAIARRLQPFSIQQILYSGRKEKHFSSEQDRQLFQYVSFDDLLKKSDFVVIACALNQETKHLFNRRTFELMKNDSILINIARGGIIDQDALYDALTTGKIQAAGLDVTTPEPFPRDHPLLKLDNCTIFPHIGSADTWARNQMAQICADNLLNFFGGKPMVHELNVDDVSH